MSVVGNLAKHFEIKNIKMNTLYILIIKITYNEKL